MLGRGHVYLFSYNLGKRRERQEGRTKWRWGGKGKGKRAAQVLRAGAHGLRPGAKREAGPMDEYKWLLELSRQKAQFFGTVLSIPKGEQLSLYTFLNGRVLEWLGQGNPKGGTATGPGET